MTSVEKDCDRLVQQVVVERDKVCQRPGCNNPATAGHHVFGGKAAKMGVRWVPDSCLGLCVECHDGWARRHPNRVHCTLMWKVGNTRYHELYKLSLKVCRFRPADFREIRQELRMMIGRGE